jgi:pimeloyl-ACP methyl ester carboxylesterase
MASMRITTDDGVGLAVEVTGSGPGLVLVHGHGGAKEDFGDHVATLARDHTVVTFDHRGHGASDKPSDRAAYSLERLRDDIFTVVDELELDRFRLLGHSMGGMCARKVVIAAPDRVTALVMMDTCTGPIPGFDPALMEAAAEVGFTRGKDALLELLEMASPLETPAHRRLVANRAGYDEFNKRKEADMSEVMWGAMAIAMAHQPDDTAALAEALACPMLIIVGEQDKPMVIAAELMKDALPSAQLAVIPDAGHSPQFENGDAWIEVMTTFLASVPAGAR